MSNLQVDCRTFHCFMLFINMWVCQHLPLLLSTVMRVGLFFQDGEVMSEPALLLTG